MTPMDKEQIELMNAIDRAFEHYDNFEHLDALYHFTKAHGILGALTALTTRAMEKK